MVEPANPDGFDVFELVLLKRPANLLAVSDAKAEELQRLHLAHFTAMHEAGHLAVAGPFDEQDDETMRGLCLYHTGSVERARELAESDPAVRAGRFEVEAMRFYCLKDLIKLPAAPSQAASSTSL
jgi:uncharacterized protein YciI